MIRDNSNPIYTRIGMGLFILSVILYLIFKDNFSTYLFAGIFLLMVSGMILASYGLTKVDVKKDKNLEKFLRIEGKIMLILIPLIIIFPLLGVLGVLNLSLVIIAMIIFLVILGILRIMLIIKVYQHIRKG